MLTLIQDLRKTFYDELSDCDNKNLYIPVVPALYDESAILMIAFEDAVDHIPKNSPPCGSIHVYAYGGAARTYSCTVWCSPHLWWSSQGKKINVDKMDLIMDSDKSKLNLDRNF